MPLAELRNTQGLTRAAHDVELSSVPRKGSRSPWNLTGVELFAGAGGLALGLRQAGFDFLLAVDSDDHSCKTLEVNGRYHVERNVLCADVRRLEYGSLSGVDLLSAGAPCQPFSAGGRLRGEGDSRNMFPEALRAVCDMQPRAFIIENVRGLLFSRARPYFDYIVLALRNPSVSRSSQQTWEQHMAVLQAIRPAGHEYWVDWRILNAADFGLAQNRQRLVIVGLRKQGRHDPTFKWPEATHTRDALIDALWGEDYWDFHRVPPAIRESVRAQLPRKTTWPTGGRWQTLRDVTSHLGPPGSRPDDPSHLYVPGARLYKGHTGSRLDWPGKTIKAGVHGSPGGEHILVEDDGSIRYLTVRECAVLQGFPDDYLFPSARSQAMRQIGNAVPTALAEAVGRSVREALISD